MRKKDLAGTPARKATASGPDGHCVAVAVLDDGTIAVLDTDDDNGPVLQFAGGEWDSFLDSVRRDRLHAPGTTDLFDEISSRLGRIARDLRDAEAVERIARLDHERRTPPHTPGDLAARIDAGLTAIEHVLTRLEDRISRGDGRCNGAAAP
ncbi:DUF397 domain-containing protein [Nocardia pseudobrasiliensis]|uniref:Uncharacterized protein DUF397 n=1 Tax=Nocardia pseudobrasiliensis TaxID=45979 RepID=A0A370HYS7_9NOCA|nr:DUF397 domain-containing protein [Nocardia pseudobrasiliensis]RDI63480.1 uncharacterized protein DUF397 [Nocardia pseudobrasiliensis]